MSVLGVRVYVLTEWYWIGKFHPVAGLSLSIIAQSVGSLSRPFIYLTTD